MFGIPNAAIQIIIMKLALELVQHNKSCSPGEKRRASKGNESKEVNARICVH